MLAASAVVLMMTAKGAMFDATLIGYFKAAVREKDAAKKGDLIEKGLAAFDFSDESKFEEFDRVFPLYLGLLGADLPVGTGLMMAKVAMTFPLSTETRAMAVEALEAYRDKIKGSKEDDPPRSESGVDTGLGPFVKASSVLQQYIDVLKSGELPEWKKEKK